jgi:hypothetical protein
MHGGTNKGPIKPNIPLGNGRAITHGIYGDLIRPDDLPFVESIEGSIGAVDNEITIAKLQLRRALKAQGIADDLPDGLEVYEVTEREGAENAVAHSEVKKKLRDYPQIIDRLLARIESLEKTRKELLADANNAPDSININISRAKKEPD